MIESNSEFIVTGEVDKSFNLKFDGFVRELNRKLVSFCEEGKIRSVTFKFKVLDKRECKE